LLLSKKEVLFMALPEKEQSLPVPRHIAIIMDGNGRWAKKRGLPRTAGHSAGGEAFRRIANYCRTLGVRYLTVYAFSTENWKRSEEEVGGIMKLLARYLEEALRDMEKNHVCFRFFGDLSRLSPELRQLCLDAQARSAGYHEVQVNFCLNYGGRDEIVRASRAFAMDVAEGKYKPEDLTEELLSKYLYSADVPDPELIIRPSGEMRTSNFLLWQSAYSEYVFMNVLWPDFGPADLDAAIEEYHRRNRRFGGT
jgi:undecaprenyl diphosphate synthase